MSVAFTLQGKAELVATSSVTATAIAAAAIDSSQSAQDESTAVAPAANTQVLYITVLNDQYDTTLHCIV
jgi:hypothetical protein